MSGGFFDYKEWHINCIAEQIEQEVILSGKPIPRKKWEYWQMERFKEHPEEAVNYEFPEPVIRKMEEAIYALRAAAIASELESVMLAAAASFFSSTAA